jgi:hypothetical protein
VARALTEVRRRLARLKRWREKSPAAAAPFLLELLEVLVALEELKERAQRQDAERRA